MQYERNDIEFDRGQFRVRGDVIEINPVHGTPPIRIELFGDEIDAISLIDAVTGRVRERLNSYLFFPVDVIDLSRVLPEPLVQEVLDVNKNLLKYKNKDELIHSFFVR